MKYYKLKKDLPTFKAGDEFYLDNDGNLRLKENGNIMAYHHSTLENFPNVLEDWFEEIPDNMRRKAKRDEVYYYIDSYGDIAYELGDGGITEKHRYETGNYKLTEEEIKSKLTYDIARQTLLDDANGGKWKKGGANLFVFYDYDINNWSICDYDYKYNIQTIGAIYFQSEEDAKKSLEKHRLQWSIVYKYEGGEM